MGQKDGLTGYGSLTGAHQFTQQTVIGFGTIPHLGFKADAIIHIIHGPGFGYNCLTGIEFHLYDLNVIPDNFIINFVTRHILSFLFISQ